MDSASNSKLKEPSSSPAAATSQKAFNEVFRDKIHFCGYLRIQKGGFYLCDFEAEHSSNIDELVQSHQESGNSLTATTSVRWYNTEDTEESSDFWPAGRTIPCETSKTATRKLRSKGIQLNRLYMTHVIHHRPKGQPVLYGRSHESEKSLSFPSNQSFEQVRKQLGGPILLL